MLNRVLFLVAAFAITGCTAETQRVGGGGGEDMATGATGDMAVGGEADMAMPSTKDMTMPPDLTIPPDLLSTPSGELQAVRNAITGGQDAGTVSLPVHDVL